DKAENKDKGKSPIVTITGFRDLNEEFAECINNSSNEVNAAGSSIFAAELNFINNTNVFSAAGPSNAVVPNLEDLSHNADDVDASQLYDDPDMPELKDITYSDNVVGVQADFNNLETSITVSPIPTTRIHKDHLVS
nr:hypothetical protein [Tanacetum cinerariifolium]